MKRCLGVLKGRVAVSNLLKATLFCFIFINMQYYKGENYRPLKGRAKKLHFLDKINGSIRHLVAQNDKAFETTIAALNRKRMRVNKELGLNRRKEKKLVQT